MLADSEITSVNISSTTLISIQEKNNLVFKN